jgi:hypothetical protein
MRWFDRVNYRLWGRMNDAVTGTHGQKFRGPVVQIINSISVHYFGVSVFYIFMMSDSLMKLK